MIRDHCEERGFICMCEELGNCCRCYTHEKFLILKLAVAIPGEKLAPFMAKWFKTAPEIQTNLVRTYLVYEFSFIANHLFFNTLSLKLSVGAYLDLMRKRFCMNIGRGTHHWAPESCWTASSIFCISKHNASWGILHLNIFALKYSFIHNLTNKNVGS